MIFFQHQYTLCILAILLVSCGNVKHTPKPVSGVIDLRTWDFSKDGNVDLSGNWEFYYGAFLNSGVFDTIRKPFYMKVPEVWTTHEWQGRKMGAHGFASYRLRIFLRPGHPVLSLFVSSQGSAYTAFLNEKLLCSNGTAGTTKETTVAYARNRIADVPVKSDTLDLVFHISNFDYRKGGLWGTITIGEKKKIGNDWIMRTYFSLVSSGMFLVFAFVLVCFFIYRPGEKAAFFFALGSLASLARILSSDEYMLVEMFPAISWQIIMKIQIASMQGVVLFNCIAITNLFPQETNRKIIKGIILVYSLILLIILVTPTGIFSYLVQFSQALFLICTVYFSIITIRAVHHKRDGALVIAVGIILTIIVSIPLILNLNYFIQVNFQTPFAIFLLFAIAQILSLSKIFGRSLTRIENFADELEVTVKVRTEELRTEKEKSERLLLNVLPDTIANRLKEGETTIADHFKIASVIFVDIVDFTKTSARSSPVDVVKMLNDIFTRFDKISARYGMEKIKTIGDCYMAASGIPVAREDHAEAAVRMALDIVDAREDFVYANPDIEQTQFVRFRIGLDCGDTVAGVIGEKKFIYDLWGDMVNTASRMESHGEPGRIHCTDRFKKQLQPFADKLGIIFQDRGELNIKGKGIMNTWFIVRKPG
jgi:class 3 adenylate cyclase